MSTDPVALPPIVDIATWETARAELLVREKAHTHEGDAIAAARRQLPMVEFDPTVTQPWYSVRDSEPPVGRDMGSITSFLRVGDRAFLTYSTTGRGNESFESVPALLDMTPFGRGERWEEHHEGRPEGRHSCWYWRTDANGHATDLPTSRPTPQWTRPGAVPVGGLGRSGMHD